MKLKMTPIHGTRRQETYVGIAIWVATVVSAAEVVFLEHSVVWEVSQGRLALGEDQEAFA